MDVAQASVESPRVKILLVEDEIEMAGALRVVLEREGFVVDHVASLADAAEAALDGGHDLVLLDRTLPDGEGLTLIGPLRTANAGVPVIVLTARGAVPDRVDGLDHGADDYLAKPFAGEELMARIRAVRRRPAGMATDRVTLARLTYDLIHDEAFVDDERLDLPRRELRVLAALIRRRGRTVLRTALEQAVYGFDDEIQSNTLDSHISRLRRKLAEAEAGVEIHAIRGVGYLLRAAG